MTELIYKVFSDHQPYPIYITDYLVAHSKVWFIFQLFRRKENNKRFNIDLSEFRSKSNLRFRKRARNSPSYKGRPPGQQLALKKIALPFQTSLAYTLVNCITVHIVFL